MRIRFHKIDGFMRVRGGEFWHLVLFVFGLFENICYRIKYLIGEKSGITDSVNHNFGEIKILYLLKTIMTFNNLLIFIKSVVNRNKNNSKNKNNFYNLSLEKGSYKDKSDTRYF